MYFDWSFKLQKAECSFQPLVPGLPLIPERRVRQLQPIYPLLIYPPYDALGPRPIVAFAVEGRS